jgi:uncharacterized RDD family membrane protein YckC
MLPPVPEGPEIAEITGARAPQSGAAARVRSGARFLPPLEMGPLTSRGRRLVGYLFDFVFTLGAGVLLSRLYARFNGGARTLPQVWACIVAAMSVQWGLIAWRGQTVGKVLVRTRIALANGANPGFVRGVALRAWPLLFIQSLPPMTGSVPGLRLIVSLAFLGDALLLLRADRRCAHDHVAGTFVVDVG